MTPDNIFDQINRTVVTEQVLDALMGAEEILEVLHTRGTDGLLRESSAGRIANVLTKVQVAKAIFGSVDVGTAGRPIPVQIAELQARIAELRALEDRRVDSACRETLDRAWRSTQ